MLYYKGDSSATKWHHKKLSYIHTVSTRGGFFEVATSSCHSGLHFFLVFRNRLVGQKAMIKKLDM